MSAELQCMKCSSNIGRPSRQTCQHPPRTLCSFPTCCGVAAACWAVAAALFAVPVKFLQLVRCSEAGFHRTAAQGGSMQACPPLQAGVVHGAHSNSSKAAAE